MRGGLVDVPRRLQAALAKAGGNGPNLEERVQRLHLVHFRDTLQPSERWPPWQGRQALGQPWRRRALSFSAPCFRFTSVSVPKSNASRTWPRDLRRSQSRPSLALQQHVPETIRIMGNQSTTILRRSANNVVVVFPLINWEQKADLNDLNMKPTRGSNKILFYGGATPRFAGGRTPSGALVRQVPQCEVGTAVAKACGKSVFRFQVENF